MTNSFLTYQAHVAHIDGLYRAAAERRAAVSPPDPTFRSARRYRRALRNIAGAVAPIANPGHRA